MKNFLANLKEGMKNFGDLIGAIVNFTLLFVAYILGIGPTAILAKIKNKHFLNLKMSKSAKTYWLDLPSRIVKKEDYYRQF